MTNYNWSLLVVCHHQPDKLQSANHVYLGMYVAMSVDNVLNMDVAVKHQQILKRGCCTDIFSLAAQKIQSPQFQGGNPRLVSQTQFQIKCNQNIVRLPNFQIPLRCSCDIMFKRLGQTPQNKQTHLYISNLSISEVHRVLHIKHIFLNLTFLQRPSHVHSSVDQKVQLKDHIFNPNWHL